MSFQLLCASRMAQGVSSIMVCMSVALYYKYNVVCPHDVVHFDVVEGISEFALSPTGKNRSENVLGNVVPFAACAGEALPTHCSGREISVARCGSVLVGILWWWSFMVACCAR